MVARIRRRGLRRCRARSPHGRNPASFPRGYPMTERARLACCCRAAAWWFALWGPAAILPGLLFGAALAILLRLAGVR